MNIALDAMGGDHAPAAIVIGALQALNQLRGNLTLIGRESEVLPLLPTTLPANLRFVHAPEVVEMDEKPTDALRRKKNSSLAVAIELVKSGEAQAMVSAGNTGAATAGSLLSWRTIEGVRRPAIASPFPNALDGFLLLDAGASPDIEPESLVEFGVMGRAYAKEVMGRSNPTVHLLNIGEEPGKGNAFSKRAFDHLAAHCWFAGNIEGKDMFRSRCDVVVCDAFVGNIVLKTAEGVGEFVMHAIRQELPSNKLAQLAFLPAKKLLSPLRKKMDYAEYGGSPLLGLNGLTMICHGRSNSKAIVNALIAAERAIASNLVQNIRESVAAEIREPVP